MTIISERNKAAARAVFEVWSTGDLARLDQYVAHDVIHHDPYDPYGAEGLVGMKRSISTNRHMYPDLHIEVEDQIAEGSKLASRWTATMTHEGKKVILTGITIDRFEGDKIIEAWRCMDMLRLLRQTGTIAES